MTTTELMVTLGITAALISVSIVSIGAVHHSRSRAACASNLHAIYFGFISYTGDNQDVFPLPSRTAQWEDLLRPYVSRATFRCPADNELFTSLGSSYDWRDTGNPYTTLAGRPNLRVRRNDLSVAYDALPGWHTAGQIQVLQADGSVNMMDQQAFFRDLQRAPDQP